MKVFISKYGSIRLNLGGRGAQTTFQTVISFIFIPRLKKKTQTKNSRTAMDLKLVAYTSVCIHVCRDRLENLNYRETNNNKRRF